MIISCQNYEHFSGFRWNTEGSSKIVLRANYKLYIMSVEKDVQFNFKDQAWDMYDTISRWAN